MAISDLINLLIPPQSETDQPAAQVFTPNLDRGRLFLIWLFQFAVFIGGIGICLSIGASLWFWGTGSIIFLLLSSGLGWLMWRNANTPDPLPPRSCLFWHMRAGTWLTSLTTLAIALALSLRINWKESLGVGLFFCGFLFLFGIATFFLSRYAMRHQSTPWFHFSVGVTMIPLLLAWLMASTVAAWVKPQFRGGISSQIEEQYREKELGERKKWADNKGWRTANSRPINVAILLSGGGYRAAAFHAGLLKALDEKCVPIRFLSTVSGGSIVGAYYALGYPPDLFMQRLIDQRPGLPDDMLNLWFVMSDLFWPSWNSAETYARHLETAFFKNKTLADTGRTPTLLVNATDPQTSLVNASDPATPPDWLEVFYRDRNPQYPELNKTKLADVVAASAAFPGVFQPKTIVWPAEGSNEAPQSRRFIDGGVVENWGYRGLYWFSEHSRHEPKVDLLILSDASTVTIGGTLPPKVEPLELLARSQGISEMVKRTLLDSDLEYLKEQINQQAVLVRFNLSLTLWPSNAFDSLWHLWYPSAKDPNKVNGYTVAQEVAQYPTLRELSGDEVKKASWIGYQFVQDQWPGIDTIRKRLGGKGSECPET